MTADIELSLRDKRRGGYTTAAEWLSKDPDNETLVFRKFDKLAALNLLYLQSEVLEIEKRIDRLGNEAICSSDWDLHEAARRWETLVRQASEADPEFKHAAREKMELICSLRSKIKEYREYQGLKVLGSLY